jgi:hypothetical protein
MVSQHATPRQSEDGLAESEGPVSRPHWTDRLARTAFLIIVATTAYGLFAGSLVALTWPLSALMRSEAVSYGVYLLPVGLYALAVLLSVPILLASLWKGMSGHGRQSGTGLLMATGPITIFLGFTLLSHLLFIPCASEENLWPSNTVAPWLCEGSGGYGIKEQLHVLHHTLAPTMFLVVLYWAALRTWCPAVTQLRSPGTRHRTVTPELSS